MKTMLLKSLTACALVATAFAVGCGDDDGSAGTSGVGAMDGGGMGGTGGTSGMGGTGGTDDDAGGMGGTSGAGGTGGSCDSTQVTEVDGNITTDTEWDCGTYLLQRIIYVTDDATLTIRPGVKVLGDVDASTITALIVSRGSKLMAEGTANDPIVFSSSADAGDRNPADWGGVVLLGKARINSGGCIGGTGTSCTGGFLQNNIEGLPPSDPNSVYGGTDDTHDCGTIRYARIEFAGYELATDKELNGLSVGACGSDTTLSHIQVHRGSDDGIEFFGGSASMDHIVLTANSDDSLDWDLGWTGKVQFLVVHQATNDGDKGFEADNNGDDEVASPRSNPTIYNATMIGNPTKTGILLREGTRATLRNFLVQDFSVALDLAAAQYDVTTEWPTNLSIEESCFHNNTVIGDGDSTDDDGGFNENDAVLDAARSNVTDVDPMLGSISITAPDYLPTSTMLGDKATPPTGMDATATYCGAFAQGGTDWTAGWTAFPEN